MTNEELETKLDEEFNHIHDMFLKRVQADEIIKLTQALAIIISLKERSPTESVTLLPVRKRTNSGRGNERSITMKVFISQPMNGRSAEEIQTEREAIKARIRKEFGEDVEFIQSYHREYKPTDGSIPIKYLAKSIEAMADADLVYFADNWNDVRGCRIENEVAIEYGLDIIESYKNYRRKVIK